MSEIDRRKSLELGALFAMTAPLMPGATAHAADMSLVNFNDPDEAFKAKIKTLGSIADEEAFRLSTGHIYGYVPDHPPFSMFNIENYSVSRWKRLKNGNYQFTLWEIGVHTDRDTGQPLKTYKNPITEEEVDVIPYATGPIEATVTPEGILIPGAERTVRPEALLPRIFDDHVWYPFESLVTLPNPLSVEEWPKASAGELFSWHTIVVFAAKLDDIANAETTWAPALTTYSEFLTWQPWLHMGQTPGGMMTRGYGKKFGPEEKIPMNIRKKIEASVPEIFDRDNWTERRNEFTDYLDHYKT
jgi:hypothetical protein